ncbi:MAG: ParB N-terminal domain-containing protein [Rhodospirillaceae bacterium]|nr:ParB N-terminal domain-containing protein [Rhodospirillaceae bacterium]
MKISKIKISKIVPYASNSRTHSSEQISQIAASIKEFGFNNPVLIDGSNVIIAGHGRVLAAEELGLDTIPVVILDHLSESQRKAYVIADNKLALNAGWDIELLALEMGGLKDEGFDLSLIGFDNDELANIFVDKTKGLTDPDAVPDIPDDPVTKEGDVWICGKHRIMCGDSTSIDAVDKLMGGVKIDLIHTDPPYGIDEKGDRSKRKGAESLSDGIKYVDFNDSSTDAAQEAFALCEVMNIPRQVWWGANHYAHAVPQTANWFVWDKRVEEKQKDLNSDCELAWVKSKWSSVRIFRHLWKGLIKASEHGQKRVHPTQKPVALIEWVFDYYKDIKTVLDLFGGSGSTLIAAEIQNKQCYMMEFTPHYCDVIIKRWQDFTGEVAILESTKKHSRKQHETI